MFQQINLYEPERIPLLIVKLFSFIVVGFIVYRSVKSYKDSERKTKAKKWLTVSFILGIIGSFYSTLNTIINVFFPPMPNTIYRFLGLAYYLPQIISLSYTIHFTTRAFYQKYSKILLTTLDIFSGVCIGALFMSTISVEMWTEDGSPPMMVVLMLVLNVIIIFSLTAYYAIKSSIKQESKLLKVSMALFGAAGIVIVLQTVIMMFTLMIFYSLESASVELIILINAVLFLFQPISQYMMYIGCYNPEWFAKKYKESWITMEFRRKNLSTNRNTK